MLKVLFASWYNSQNTYLKNIVGELYKYCEIVCSAENFWCSNLRFDIIHIQWPEELFARYGMVKAEEIENFKNRIEFWKTLKAKIVVTCHNEYPHYSEREGKLLFEWIYMNADAVVHFGEYSKMKIGYTSVNKHVIIAHPNYNNIVEETLTKEKARQYLNIPANEKLFISIGAIRFKEEEDQLTEAYKKIHQNGYGLIIRDSFLIKTPISFMSQPGNRIKRDLKVNRLKKLNVRFYSKAIPESQLKYYLTACDVVISPRVNSLNSGVIYLALSFGKPVVGPNIGNMNEILEATGNPAFAPNDVDSFSMAMKKAMEQAGIIGRKNKEYANTVLNPELIAKQHYELYNALVKPVKVTLN